MVTAKFRVSRLTPWGGTKIEDGRIVPAEPGGKATGEVELTPDYAGGKNAGWSEATPSGVIRLSITNPSALAQFKQDGSYTVTFEETE